VERLLIAFELEQDIAAITQRLGKIGPDRERPVIAVERLLIAFELKGAQHGCAAVMCLGKIGLDSKRLMIAVERLLIAFELERDIAGITQRLVKMGRERGGPVM